MKKTKFRERLNKAITAFFNDEETNSGIELYHSGNTALLHTEIISDYKFSKILKYLRQALLFFPGAAALLDVSIIFTWQAVGLYIPAGFIYWNGMNYLKFIAFLSVAGLFSILGLGKLRSKKDLLIPASIIGTGVILGSFLSVSTRFFPEIGLWLYLNGNTIIFLPLGLIAGILAKGWIDKDKTDLE